MKRLAVCAALFAAVSLPVAAAPAHRPLAQVRTDLERVHAFDQVAISPDGKRVAWSEAASERRGAKTVTTEAIYVAEVARGTAGARRITVCPTRPPGKRNSP